MHKQLPTLQPFRATGLTGPPFHSVILWYPTPGETSSMADYQVAPGDKGHFALLVVVGAESRALPVRPH
jgi:hypothetical protein